jgi:O-antigen ligase
MRVLTALLVVAGGVALAALPLSSAALVVAGSALVLVTLARPEASLYLLAFAVPFGSLRTVSLGGMSLTATEVLVALMAAAWLGRGAAQRSVRIGHVPLALPLVLVLLAQVLSVFDAISLTAALKEIIKWAEIVAVYVITSSILFPADRLSIARPSALGILLTALMAAALAEALLGVYQFLTRAGPEWFLIGRFMRAYGTFAQPNPYAGYLNLSLPVGYALLLWSLERAAAQRGRRVLVIGVWLAVVGAAFLMSFSRGAWLGGAIAAAAITLLHSKRSAMLATAGGLLMAVVLFLGSASLLPSALTDRFTSVTDYFRVFDVRHVEVTDANFAVVERMAHWQAAWGMINDRPWLGFGAGNYAAAYPRYALAGWKEPLGHAHNVLLNTWAETGIVGLAAYLVFLAAALWTCLRVVLRRTAAETAADSRLARAIALGVLGVLLAKITHEMLDNLWVHSMGVQVALLLAMIVPAHNHADA